MVVKLLIDRRADSNAKDNVIMLCNTQHTHIYVYMIYSPDPFSVVLVRGREN